MFLAIQRALFYPQGMGPILPPRDGPCFIFEKPPYRQTDRQTWKPEGAKNKTLTMSLLIFHRSVRHSKCCGDHEVQNWTENRLLWVVFTAGKFYGGYLGCCLLFTNSHLGALKKSLPTSLCMKDWVYLKDIWDGWTVTDMFQDIVPSWGLR